MVNVNVNTYGPTTLMEALAIRRNKDTIVYSGGTDLMVRNRALSGLMPKFDKDILFICFIEELKKIVVKADYIRIGSCCTLSELMKSSYVPEILRDALSQMASPAIRNMGTIGGNICNASPAGDTLPPLYALEAKVVLVSMGNKREILLKDFISGPGKKDIREGELLSEILIPNKSFTGYMYKKVGTRKADALSKLSFAMVYNIQENIIVDIRLAFGAVAATVIKDTAVEECIGGMSKYELGELIDNIVSHYEVLIRPIDDQRSTAEYRKDTALRMLKYALKFVIA